jgi:MraZ protein
MLFLGEFEHSLDAKQRLAVPSELRNCLPNEGNDAVFVSAPGPNGFLWLWPEKTFADLSNALGGSLLGDEGVQNFERLIFSQSSRCPMDKAGRVRIPDRMLERYGLSGNIMILGVRDHLELCTTDKWKEERERLEPAAADIWRRARETIRNRTSS